MVKLYLQKQTDTRNQKLNSCAHKCAARYFQSECNYEEADKITISRVKVSPDGKIYTIFIYSNTKKKIISTDVKIMEVEMKDFLMKNLYVKKIKELKIKFDIGKTNNIVEVEKALESIKAKQKKYQN